MAKKIILFLALFGSCMVIRAQEEKIDPERPDQSESPDLVQKNIFQAEFGFNKNNNSGKDYDLLYPTTLFKYGLKKIELRLEAAFMSSYEHLIPNPQWETGLAPVSLGFKVNLSKERNIFPKTSFIAGFGIPVFASKVFRADHIAPSFKLVMQHTLSEHADLSYNLGAEWDGFSKTPDWLYTLSQNFSFGENWNSFIEVYGSVRKGESPQHNIDTGVGYCLSNNTKVDFSFGSGISKAAPKSFVALGFSFRIKTNSGK